MHPEFLGCRRICRMKAIELPPPVPDRSFLSFGCIRKLWGWRAMGRWCFRRDLPGPHEDLRGGQDCANLGRVPFARRRRERATRPPHGLCGDWPSQTLRLRLGQSPTLPSLSRECCAWTDRTQICTVADWHSLCSSGCVLQRIVRVKGATLVAKNPGCASLSWLSFTNRKTRLE